MAIRVIAGSAGGIFLKCPRNGHVRPTMDQVRAAIFSSLAERIEGAAVLDLFAGTGGFGIEALSRGAKTATFIEKDRRTCDYIRENLAKTRLESGANVIFADVFAYCSKARQELHPKRFDLIFADPPYQTRDHPADLASRLLAETKVSDLLAADGVLILEKSPKSALVGAPNDWQVLRQKRYGTAEVVFLQHAVVPESEAIAQTSAVDAP